MKKMVLVQGLVAAAAAALLVACGGGGGAPFPGGGSGGAATPTPPSTAASRAEVMLDKLSLPSSGTEFSTLTVTTVNVQGNTVAGVPVTVTVSDGVFTATSAGGVSDASGKFTGTIGLGGNRSNRAITVTVTAQGATPVSNQVIVTGSSMVVNGLPSAVAVGGNAQGVTLKVLDSAGQPIAGQDVALLQALPTGVTLSQVFPAKTNGSGEITFNLAVASNAPVVDTILGFVVGDPSSSLSIKASRPLSVTSASGGGSGVPDVPAGTVVSSATVGAVPTFVAINSADDVTNKSKITARFLNPANAGIANMRVKFTISSNPLGAEQLLPNDKNKGGDVRTFTTFANADGIAEVNYAPGERSSPTNGVTVAACYAFTDADLATCTPTAVPARLTVGGKPLSISIFDGNTLGSVGAGHQIYQQTLYIQVVDAGGNVVPNADFSGSVDITEYRKGANWTIGAGGSGTPPAIITSCPNEDTNRNGSIDAGEDVNGNNRLDPRKADVSIAFPEGKKTNAGGYGTVQVSWGQNVATWLNYVVTVSANADSSEGIAQRTFITTFIEGDQKNGTFLTAPYGSGSCNSPN